MPSAPKHSEGPFWPDGARLTFRADDGLEIVGEVRGQGDTALVFLHGWCGDREYWKHQVEVFAADYRVVALDQAGHGESGKGRKAWTADGLAGDVETVVKALGLKHVILVGHSMGGSVALLAAKRMPGTVIAVIGVDTLQNAEFKLPEEVRKSILDGVEKDFKGTVRVTIAGLLPEKADAELKTWLQTKAEGQDPKMALALMRDLFGLDTRKLLKEAKVPVRCINSAGGYKFFTPTAVETNKKYADFGAVTIDGVGHHPMLEKPDEFNRKLRDVLKELRPRSEPASPGTGAGRRTFVVLRSCLLVTLGVVGCQQKPALQAPPPPTVVVAKPVKKEIVEWQYFTAQTQAVDTVAIIPRVTGYIDNILFKEGDVVNFGDLLYVIDPRPYQAALDQAKGQLEQALAQQKLDNANLERAKDLLAKKVIAQQDFDTTASQKYVADAQVVASQAAVESAQLNLDFTQIRSPLHGRIGAQLVNRGNLVQANSTQLTTIVSIDPIYAYFNVDEASVHPVSESH